MDTRARARSMLRTLFAVAGLALVLGVIPVHAQMIMGLGPSSSGSISLVFNGTGNPIDVTLPTDLSGTGYEFDSVGGSTVFSPSATDLTPFSSSGQGTTLSLGGGSPGANGTEPNPVPANADISSGEVYLVGPLRTPEPSSLSLLVIGLISILGSAVVRRKFSRT
jgi:hypothetical protein